MTSVRGVDNYAYLVQAEQPKPKTSQPIEFTSVYKFLSSHPDFSIMKYIVDVANLNKKLDDFQYNQTIFLTEDKNIQIPMKEIMDFDRCRCIDIINRSSLNRRINLRSFLDKKLSLIDTVDRSYNLRLEKLEDEFGNEFLSINNATILGQTVLSNGIMIFTDKMLVL
jgi:hypothetical protein